MPIGVLGLRTRNKPFPCLFRGDICDFSSQVSPLFSLFAKKSLLKKYVLWRNFPLITEASRCLQSVVIENKDFEKLIAQYDRPNTIFYLGPPYYETEDYYEDVGFGRDDHERLSNALVLLKWMSYYYPPIGSKIIISTFWGFANGKLKNPQIALTRSQTYGIIMETVMFEKKNLKRRGNDDYNLCHYGNYCYSFADWLL